MLVNEPYTNWAKICNALSNHKSLWYHRDSVRDTDSNLPVSKISKQYYHVIGYYVILADIGTKIKSAKFFSVLANEVSSHNAEHLPICLCYVDNQSNICEDFISFLKLERVQAVDIADAIIICLDNLGLSLSDLRGQGYDAASIIGRCKNGVQARIKEKQLKVIYIYCSGHALNLYVVSSCSVLSIRNCIDSIKNLTIWIKNLAKREGLLKAIMGENTHPSSRNPLRNICILIG